MKIVLVRQKIKNVLGIVLYPASPIPNTYFLLKKDGSPPQLSSSSSVFRGVFGISDFDTSFPAALSCFSGVSSIFFISSRARGLTGGTRSEEHTSELQSQSNLLCR